METNNKCVMLKPSEYKKLKEQAESKKPDYINIKYNHKTSYYACDIEIESSFILSKDLLSQVKRITFDILKKYQSLHDRISEAAQRSYKDGYNDALKHLVHMHKKDQKKILKQYKNN